MPQRARTLMVVAMMVLTGCTQETEFDIERVQFNARLRTDGQPLDVEQQASADAGFGPYQVRDDQLISPLYPVASTTGLDGRTSNLIQSDCLWLGRDGSTGAGDRVEMSWEEVWTFAQLENQAPADDEARSVGLCTYTNPVWRDAVQLSFDELDTGQHTLYASRSDHALRVSTEPVQLPGDRLIFACEAARRPDGSDGIHCDAPGARMYGARLQRHQHTQPDNVANPDGQCQASPIRSGPVQFVSHLTDAVAPVSVQDYLPVCSIRSGWQPQRDSSLQLSTAMVAPLTIDFGPNLMVVDQQRSLRRQMNRQSNSTGAATTEQWSWQTPVQLNASDQPRWQENFSASLWVDRVAVKLRRGGAPRMQAVTQELCVLGDDDRCLYQCRAQAQADGALYQLDRTYCRNAQGNAASPELTPTYDHLYLDSEPGHPQTTPLRWVLTRAPALAVGDEVLLEFNLRARTRNGAALLADHSAFDFGAVQLDGVSARMETLLRNVGDQALQLQDVRVVGLAADDFNVLLPELGQALPLPIDLLPSDAPQTHRIALSVAFFQQPMLEIHAPKTQALGVFQPRVSEAAFALYDQPFNIQQGMLIGDAPDGDYVQAAIEARHREYPQLAEEAVPLLGRPWMAMAEQIRTLPDVLAVGEAVRLSVAASPRALGRREAMLQVRASTMAGAALSVIQLPLRLQALSGPILDAVPPALSFPRTQSGRLSFERRLLVTNVGDVPGELLSVDLVGAEASVFSLRDLLPTPISLQPGQVEVFSVLARPPRCNATPRSYRAAVHFKLRGGEQQVVDLQSACAP